MDQSKILKCSKCGKAMLQHFGGKCPPVFMPDACKTCLVMVGDSIGCDDCGHGPQRRAYYNSLGGVK